MLRLGAGIAHRPRTEHQTGPALRGTTRTYAMSSASRLLSPTNTYADEGRRLLGLRGTNGGAVKIEAVNADDEYVDPSDDLAAAWLVCWTGSDGYYVEKTYDSHDQARIIAGVLKGTHC